MVKHSRDKGFGINPIIIKSVAQQVAEVAKMDCEIAVIVGGGNIWRGKTGSDLGMDRGTADRLHGYACYSYECSCTPR